MPKKAKKNSPILLIVQSFPLSHAPGGIRQAQTKKKKRTFCNFDLFLGHLGHVNRGLPLYLSVRMKHDNEKKKNCQKEKKLQFWRPFFCDPAAGTAACDSNDVAISLNPRRHKEIKEKRAPRVWKKKQKTKQNQRNGRHKTSIIFRWSRCYHRPVPGLSSTVHFSLKKRTTHTTKMNCEPSLERVPVRAGRATRLAWQTKKKGSCKELVLQKNPNFGTDTSPD